MQFWGWLTSQPSEQTYIIFLDIGAVQLLSSRGCQHFFTMWEADLWQVSVYTHKHSTEAWRTFWYHKNVKDCESNDIMSLY